MQYSVCIPSNCVSHCANLEQVTHFVYQIAKTATLFKISELIILDLDDKAKLDKAAREKLHPKAKPLVVDEEKVGQENKEEKLKKDVAKINGKLPNSILISILLQFFITPPYLRSMVFKKKYLPYFKFANKLPRLTTLPFMQNGSDNTQNKYREGLSIQMKHPTAKKRFKQTSYINIGREKPIKLKGQLVPTNVRVTINLETQKIVSPMEAYGNENISFGYTVRIAPKFSNIFTPIGSSNNNNNTLEYTQTIWINSQDYFQESKDSFKIKEIDSLKGNNILLIFGNLKYLKKSFHMDNFVGIESVKQFFDGQLTLPETMIPGNITIEDAIMVGMSVLSSRV